MYQVLACTRKYKLRGILFATFTPPEGGLVVESYKVYKASLPDHPSNVGNSWPDRVSGAQQAIAFLVVTRKDGSRKANAFPEFGSRFFTR